MNPQTATGRGGVGLPCYFDQQDFLSVLKSYMLQLLSPMISRLKPGEFFLEKTPEHGMFIPEIKELLPECRIIHILRDGRDVVASILAASRTWGSSWAPRNARGAALMWVERVQTTRDAARKLSEREFCEVTYEELWASTDRVLKRLSEFLGITWSDAEIRDAIDANRSDVTKAGGGTPVPIYGEVAKRTGPVAREPEEFVHRGMPGGWKKDLSLREKFQVWCVASGTMAEAGYPSSLSRWLFVDGPS
ncbi:MAG: sulfotransferase [Deltaproteobacteria bacterium]|nr:sulfotransferase [Deltaproteobacteria bacterium]